MHVGILGGMGGGRERRKERYKIEESRKGQNKRFREARDRRIEERKDRRTREVQWLGGTNVGRDRGTDEGRDRRTEVTRGAPRWFGLDPSCRDPQY